VGVVECCRSCRRERRVVDPKSFLRLRFILSAFNPMNETSTCASVEDRNLLPSLSKFLNINAGI